MEGVVSEGEEKPGWQLNLSHVMLSRQPSSVTAIYVYAFMCTY